MDLAPPAKKIRPIPPDIERCILCHKQLAAKGKEASDIVRKPTVDGLQALFTASEVRLDKVYHDLLPFKDDILTGAIEVAFHKSCRASYTSKSNLKHVHVDNSQIPDKTLSEESISINTRLSRNDTSSFNIRQHCFVCSKGWRKGEKLTQIATGTGQSTHEKMLAAAIARNDEMIILRMTTYSDLFAFDAKYHRGCYAAYISERNITAARRKFYHDKGDSEYDMAFKQLVSNIQETIFSRSKSVKTLSQVKTEFEQNLTNLGMQVEVYSWKLKEKLSQCFGDKLVFIERRGRSDLLVSSTVSVGDALRKASELQEQCFTDDTEDLCDLTLTSGPSEIDERQILHSAAKILRYQMASICDSNLYYEPPTQLNMLSCAKFVPNLLYDFVMWVTNDKSYKHISDCGDANVSKNDLATLAICHDIISKSRHVRTPITLGIGVYVHHEFGSKLLIDKLHSLGHCISYDEVRRFLTSVAIDQQDQTMYVPRGLQLSDDHNLQIDAAIDNFDQNEETLDGKSTNHAMAAVVFQRGETQKSEESPIPRVTQKSIKHDDNEVPLARYIKPAQRPEPNSLTDSSITESCSTSPAYATAQNKDILWKLARVRKEGQSQCIPSWTGFNSFISEESPPVAAVRYLPFIQASPTDLSTIYTVLLQLVQLAEKLGQDHILVTADMAIYSKAQEILWAKPPALCKKVTMRVGGMHLTMAFIASLGHLYCDGGLLSLLTDFDVYAVNTARKMLQGKEYARGLRGLKLVHEALFRMLLLAMESWLQEQGRTVENPIVAQNMKELQDAFAAKDFGTAIKISNGLQYQHIDTLITTIDEFRQVGRTLSQTFSYWDMFLDGGDILLRLLRAEREANFSLHLNAVCETIPWFVAAGRHTYAKFVPTYIADMKNLKDKDLPAYKHLNAGGFVIRRSSKHRFNSVATDQALEQTINRDGKSKGGVIGLTLRKGALTRWLKTRHVTAEYAESFKSLCSDHSRGDKPHEELGNARLVRDEQDVTRIMEAASQYQNPFDVLTVPSELINIATGQVASAEVSKSLTSFLDKGKKKHQDFLAKRLIGETKDKSFWAPEPRMKVQTFSDMRKGLPTKKTDRFMIDSEVLFRRLLVVSKQRDVNLESVLTHELAAVPPSLFHDDGTMRKCTKSDLAKKLEATCDEVLCLNTGESTAYVVDGMALLQSLKDTQFTTFDDLGHCVLRRLKGILNSNLGVGAIAIVFDRYDSPNSIKQLERQRRGEESGATFDVKAGRTVPNYRKFLKNSANKASLSVFVSEYILLRKEFLLGGQELIIAGGFVDGCVTKCTNESNVSDLIHLFSSHEEADTRMVLHAIDLSERYDRIVIRSDDTDVMVLLLYYTNNAMLRSSVYMEAGHNTQSTNRQRYVPISIIAETLGNDVCQSLPAAHALTGCDTTSSFYKVGKSTVYSKLLQHTKEEFASLGRFGMSGNLEDDVTTARRFILSIFKRKKQTCATLDRLRYVMASTTDKSAADLPPTEDAFCQHVRRARYQVAIWCQSHVPMPILGEPMDNGWAVAVDGSLEPVMFTKEIAPTELRNLTHLHCTDSDCSLGKKCQCLHSGLKCTEFCKCGGQDCQNTISSTFSDSDGSDETD